MVFTLFAAFAVWQLRNNPEWTGWLGIAAHAQVFMVLGALAWALGRRLVATFARDGVTVDDRENSDDV